MTTNKKTNENLFYLHEKEEGIFLYRDVGGKPMLRGSRPVIVSLEKESGGMFYVAGSDAAKALKITPAALYSGIRRDSNIRGFKVHYATADQVKAEFKKDTKLSLKVLSKSPSKPIVKLVTKVDKAKNTRTLSARSEGWALKAEEICLSLKKANSLGKGNMMISVDGQDILIRDPKVVKYIKEALLNATKERAQAFAVSLAQG